MILYNINVRKEKKGRIKMARSLRLDDIKMKPRIPEPIPPPKHKLTYFCLLCNKYHYIYSNIGNDHRDYKITKAEERYGKIIIE